MRLINFIKKHRRAFSVICVSSMLAGLLYGANFVLMNKASYKKYSPFYNSELSFDVLFFGTSHAYDGISPLYLWEKYGITSYNMAYDSGSVAISYWNLRRAVEEGRKPEIAVVDVFENRNDKDGAASIGTAHVTNDMLPLDLEKLRAAGDMLESETDREKLLFPFSEYHNRWKLISKNDIFPSEMQTQGYNVLHSVAPPDKTIIRNRDIRTSASKNQRKYLSLIAELCKEEEIKLLFINVPYSYHPEWQKRDNGVYALAEELGVPFINYMNEETDIDFDIDFHDTGHLNLTGAHKMTDIVAKELIKMGASDRREEMAEKAPYEKEKWDELYELYQESIVNYLKTCNNLKAYLSDLAVAEVDAEIKINVNAGLKEDKVYGKLLEQIEGKCEIEYCSLIVIKGKEADVSIRLKDPESGEIISEACFSVSDDLTASKL